MTLETAINQYKEVSQAEFFASVGQMNVHPSPQGRYGAPDYRSDWKNLNNHAIEGVSFPSCKYDGSKDRYFVTRGV